MNIVIKRNKLREFLKLSLHDEFISYEVLESHHETTFERQLIRYIGSEEDEIRAYLFLPKGEIIGAILVHHQHNGERHLGKSEVAGLAGDPFQHFCPALVEHGVICLAPDSISFEDRRTNKQGVEPDQDPDDDVLQHYNEMAYRLLQGKLLMTKVIDDSIIAVSLLSSIPEVPKDKIGILGHSYGGNTVIFHSPFDERISFSCSSGAVCSYRNKLEQGTGIELAEVIPGFLRQFDIEDLITSICPRDLLIVSGTEDKYAMDARAIFEKAKTTYVSCDSAEHLILKEYEGGHALDQERFDDIIGWLMNRVKG